MIACWMREASARWLIDEASRENLAIGIDVSLTGERVKSVLERLSNGRGLPATIQSDNGPEFRAGCLISGQRGWRQTAVHRAGEANPE